MNIQNSSEQLKQSAQPFPDKPEEPIRDQFLHEDRLRSLGEDLAANRVPSLYGMVPFDFQKRIRDNAQKILEVYRATNAAQAKGEITTPAAQWLLDNNYLVEETSFQIKRDLPARFYRELPTMTLPDGTMVPRVLALAWAYVAHSDSQVNGRTFKFVVDGFQETQPMKIGELWALPSMLRFVLVENLRRIAVRVDRSRRMRQTANEVADRVLATPDNDEDLQILAPYAAHARDTTFSTQLLYRLRDGSQNSGKALNWLERELEQAGTDAEETTIKEHQTLSSGNVTIGNVVRGLRQINDVEWTEWFEGVSRIDALLREKTDIATLDFSSRDQYRQAIEDLAKRADMNEYDVAMKAVQMAGLSNVVASPVAESLSVDEATAKPVETARVELPDDATNIGFFLIGSRRQELEEAIGYKPKLGTRLLRAFRSTGWAGIVVPVFLLTVLLMTLAGGALSAIGLPGWAVALLLVFFSVPASEGALGFFITVTLLFLKPTRLVGYEYAGGVPADARTLVVVPTLIGSRDDVEDTIRMLEVHHLANSTGALHFAALSDWPDSSVEQDDADDEILAFAQAEIDKLNARYPATGGEATRFFLLHRRRLYNSQQHKWMGWERKRGKLHELNLLLRGDPDTTFLPPSTPLPKDVVHVMTLDADTRMTRDAVEGLVGKLCHPLNRPVIDAKTGKVTAGYSILQPRVTPSLTTGDEASFLQRVFSANRGIDPYVFAVSDLYQDVFGQGTFTGKGLYHVDAFESALHDRIAENTVLSHDLLEGSLARAALVTDVEVVEDYPTRYSVDASRQHRWARGDWQLLGYIFDPKSGIPALSRWKMIDNLRRSVTPIFWMLATVAGWTLLPFTQAAQWQALLILALFMAPTFEIVDAILPKSREATARGHFTALARDTAFGTAMVALRVVLMAHSAWMMGDAIIRTLYRMFVSRQNMLEWRTASQAAKGDESLGAYYRLMYGAVVVAIVALAVPVAADSTGAFVAFAFFLFWAGSPAFAWLISRSAETEDRLIISADDKAVLRTVARRTWAYFETFVTAEHNHLPPDNFQEKPQPIVAPRTSPTNVGVYLLSIVSARDFGWISLSDTVSRIDVTMKTIEGMERYRGHLYNWYDTTSLRPLYPLYVSAVDSGNLAGHLIAVSAACSEWAEAPSVHLQGDFDGILDCVTVLEESLAELPDDRRQLRPLRQRLLDRVIGMRRAVETIKTQPEIASIRTINLTVQASEIRKLAVAIDTEAKSARSAALADWATRLSTTCEAHVQDAHGDDRAVAALRSKLQELAQRCRQYAFEMDFSFLLREERKLLSIGYRVESHQLDESCYDLLASEARLTSLFGVAKGDLPTEHWFRLGRPIVEIGFRGALMSWSGSMFEYLMPPLVMKEPQGGILNQTNHLIIKRQMQYGRQKGIPWGISEAAYNARDRELTYQYTNFGVPGLGLKRGLGHNTVIAPYATILAAQYMPRAAVENLERLNGVGALGRYGYHDAVDYTPERVPEGTDHQVVYNYFAHHSGMSIVAVANAVFEGRMRDRFHSDPVIEAAELLLQEKAPRDIPVATVRTEADERVKLIMVEESPDTRLVLNPATGLRSTNMMSNGRYSTMVTATGTGYSRWGEQAVTRWQADASEDRLGSFIFIRDVATNDWWSATAEPRKAPDEICQTLFSDDKATFVKSVGTLKTEVECIVVSEGNGEARRVTIVNDGQSDRMIEVTSFAELVLAPEINDNAHPAFSKMFVETEISENRDTIYAERRKRASNEADVAAAHFVTDPTGVREAEAETDRRAFIGRGRTLSDPAAFDPGARFTGNHGFTLDPVMSLRRRVRVRANKKVSLVFWTVVGANRAEVETSMHRLDHQESFQRQAMLAWTRSQVQTRHIGLSLADAANVQKLASYLIYPDPFLRQPAEAIASGLGRQSALWPMSISGDYPIFVVRIDDVADLEIVATALRYQEYMRTRGLVADLVILNEQASSYVQDLQQAIEQLCENSRMRGTELGPRQHIFAVRRDLMEDASYKTLLAVARVALHTRNGRIFDQIERAEAAALAARDQVRQAAGETAATAGRAEAAPAPVIRGASAPNGQGLELWNGFGGFDRNGRDYVVRLSGERSTPAPWINVISNPAFGFHTSAEGASFTWSRNSRDFQLTPWSNDPVTNRPGEAFYVHDEASGRVFSPFAAVARDASTSYEARHGQGFSTFTAKRGPLVLELTQVVDPADPVKLSRLTIRNSASIAAKLRVYGYAEWVLGVDRAKSATTIVPVLDAASGALMARNPYSLDFGDRVAFLATDGAAQSLTSDRMEFIGQGGNVLLPRTVATGATLSNKVEAGTDPCAAIARDVEVPPGGEVSMLWLMGDAGSAEEVSALVEKHKAKDFGERLTETETDWRGFLDTLQVETPDQAFDAMVNNWLPYQSVACRIRARSAFYQASGAFGFRDQLQDTLALLLHDPKLARDQILNAASRQFPEGDVQHWWLPRTGAGVRTMISDDVVWLAYAVHRYVTVTGDDSVLTEEVAYLEGEPLEPGQHDSFFTPEVTDQTTSIYEHCVRGLELAIQRTSEHGLPLILGGDWNDGMNRVGEGGKGESVWLGWFLLKTLGSFGALAKERGDTKRAKAWEKHAKRLKQALESVGWDGQWYKRGSFDDGSPLGSHQSDECQIDSIAQSWSVISEGGDPVRSRTAMEAATKHLVDEDLKLIRLFTPPFHDTPKEPGYIKSYPPGVRENGGQYTHAATWFVIALAEMGRVEEAWKCYSMLNPINHALDEQSAELYRTEPYVVAADVYSAPDKGGRGGWTWYTGSAGWMYRAAVESILGIRRTGDRLMIKPALPGHWDGYAATLRLSDAVYKIRVRREEGAEPAIEIAGHRQPGSEIDLREAGELEISVIVPK